MVGQDTWSLLHKIKLIYKQLYPLKTASIRYPIHLMCIIIHGLLVYVSAEASRDECKIMSVDVNKAHLLANGIFKVGCLQWVLHSILPFMQFIMSCTPNPGSSINSLILRFVSRPLDFFSSVGGQKYLKKGHDYSWLNLFFFLMSV